VLLGAGVPLSFFECFPSSSPQPVAAINKQIAIHVARLRASRMAISP
jgi:hypothetical protein